MLDPVISDKVADAKPALEAARERIEELEQHVAELERRIDLERAACDSWRRAAELAEHHHRVTLAELEQHRPELR